MTEEDNDDHETDQPFDIAGSYVPVIDIPGSYLPVTDIAGSYHQHTQGNRWAAGRCLTTPLAPLRRPYVA